MQTLEPHQYAGLLSVIPDAPEATLPIFYVSNGRGDVYVDDLGTPRNIVLFVEGEGPGHPANAFLYGKSGSVDLREWLEELTEPTEVFCTPELSEAVLDVHPDATRKKYMVYYFDRIADSEVSYDVDVRRLRGSDTAEVSRFLPSWAWNAFGSVREMILNGAVYATYEEGSIASAAFVMDSSMKYETLSAITAEGFRRQGYGFACARRVIKYILDRAKLPRVMVPARHEAAVAFAWKLGFPSSCEVVSYHLDVF